MRGLFVVLSDVLWGCSGDKHGPGDPYLSSQPRVKESVVGRIMNPKVVHILFPEPVNMSPYMQKGLGRCDEVKDLGMGSYSGSSRWPSVISRSL